MKVAGKVAVITGGADGLGKGFAEALLERGAKGVCILDVALQQGRSTEQEFGARYGADKVVFLQCDVTCHHQLKHAFRKAKDTYGHIDIVVNNAGIGVEDTVERRSLNIDVNLKAVVAGTYLAKEYLTKDLGGRGGVIINISSMAGLVGGPFTPVYTAAKQAVIGFSRNLVQYDNTFTTDNVRLNVLCPTHVGNAGMFLKAMRLTGTEQDNSAITEEQQQYGHTVHTIELSHVVKGLMRLVEEDEHNGQVMRVTIEKGIDFQKYGGRYISKI